MRRIIGVLLVWVCVGVSVCAEERIWVGAGGANWDDPNVWTTNGILTTAPRNTDTVTINNGTAVNLTGAALADTNRFAMVQLSGNSRGTLVVGPAAYLPTVLLEVSRSGAGPNMPGKLVIDGGYFHASGLQNFGSDSPNTPAELTIINGGNYTNANLLRMYGGRMLVSNATYTALNTTYLHGSTFTSTVEVVDSTVNLISMPVGRDVQNASGKSCLNVLRMRSGKLNMSGTLEVGHSGLSSANITGVVEQTGGTITIGAAGMILMPVNTYAAGFYNLNGGLLSLLNTGDSIRIGGRDATGKGYFNMTGGVLTNKGLMYLGTTAGGYGRFEQSGGDSYFEKTITIGAKNDGVGDLNLLGGTLTLSASGANINVGNFSNALGRCYVGDAVLNATGRSIYLGSTSFGNGTLVQNGGLIRNSSTVVGNSYASSGTLIVSNGLFFSESTAGLNVGNVSNATGRCEVDGGLLSLNGVMTLGVVSNSAGSFVMNGGTVSNNGVNVGYVLGSTGSVEIAGGQLYSAGEFYVGHGTGGGGNPSLGSIATFTMSGGRVLANMRFILGSYGKGYGRISGGEIEVLASGRIDECVEVGRDPGTLGRLEMTGGILRGANELVIARDGGSTGLVYVAGGDLYFNAVRRAGGVHALYLAGGTLHPYNQNSAFNFNASLTNDIGFGDTGTQFGLSPVDKDGTERTVSVRGTFTGPGGLAKRDSGSVLLSGTLSYTGETVVESGTLALSNTVASLASGVIDVEDGATLDVTGRAVPFPITSSQLLKGEGLVAGNIQLASGARISGGSAAEPGVLTIDGNLILTDDAEVLFNMLGGVYSAIHVTGDVTLPAHPKLTVNGSADPAAQGAVMLTWGGNVYLSGTRWTVTGERDPIAVVDTGAKALRLSYIKGSIIRLL